LGESAPRCNLLSPLYLTTIKRGLSGVLRCVLQFRHGRTHVHRRRFSERFCRRVTARRRLPGRRKRESRRSTRSQKRRSTTAPRSRRSAAADGSACRADTSGGADIRTSRSRYLRHGNGGTGQSISISPCSPVRGVNARGREFDRFSRGSECKPWSHSRARARRYRIPKSL
jgi:hypothetical protein